METVNVPFLLPVSSGLSEFADATFAAEDASLPLSVVREPHPTSNNDVVTAVIAAISNLDNFFFIIFSSVVKKLNKMECSMWRHETIAKII